MLKNFFKKIRYIIEACFVWLGLRFFRALKLQNASNLAGKIAVFIGTKISVNNLARANMSKALPHLTEHQKDIIINDMWDNLGRIIGEFPHICKMSGQDLMQYVEIDEESSDNLKNLLQENRGGIFFSAHFGNWEIGPKLLQNYGFKVKTVYRPLNNHYVEKMTTHLRGVPMIEKSGEGNRKLINALKNKEYVLIMADQKITQGEMIKFFHADAVTTTSIAKIALKLGVPIIPSCVIRLDKSFKFKVIVEKPIEFKNNIFTNEIYKNITLKINQRIEDWIAKKPEQWFWVHNRWKK